MRYGLDLGLCVEIRTPTYITNKAVLVQCKRLFGIGAEAHFPKMEDDGEKQAEDMLRLTPASFFFLFNGGPQDDLQRMTFGGAGPIQFLWPFPSFFADPVPSDHFESFFTSHDPGVTVVPASRILAISAAAKVTNAKFPNSAATILAGSVPLGQFVMSLFAPCLVGDLRKPIIQLATPPSKRDSASGLDVTVPELQLRPMKKGARRFYKLTVEKSGTTTKG